MKKKSGGKKDRAKSGKSEKPPIRVQVPVTPGDLDEIRRYRQSLNGAGRAAGHSHAVDPSCPDCNPVCGTCGAVTSRSRFVAIASAAIEVNEHGQQSGGVVGLDGHGYVWQYWPARYDKQRRPVQYARWARLTTRRSLGRRDAGAIKDEFFPEGS